MPRSLTPQQQLEQALLTDYRESLWSPLCRGIRRYDMLQPGDRVCICVSGGKDSMLLALMLQLLQKHSRIPFTVVPVAMDPGYSPENRRQLEENAEKLGIPLTIFDSDVFEAAGSQGSHPCFLCARMRRGCLYDRAQSLGCNKLALGHHFDDIVQTTLMAMLWSAKIEGMRPILPSRSHPGLTLIRPMALVREEDIIRWRDENGLTFLGCACSVARAPEDSRRAQTRALLRQLRQTNPDVEKNIFNAIHHVDTDTLPGWLSMGEKHGFVK